MPPSTYIHNVKDVVQSASGYGFGYSRNGTAPMGHQVIFIDYLHPVLSSDHACVQARGYESCHG